MNISDKAGWSYGSVRSDSKAMRRLFRAGSVGVALAFGRAAGGRGAKLHQALDRWPYTSIKDLLV